MSFPLVACALCALPFDDTERVPRALQCGHVYCSACLQARVERKSAHAWSITCPVDKKHSDVKRGETAYKDARGEYIVRVEGGVARVPPPVRIHVRAGDAIITLHVPQDETVAAVKQRIVALRADWPVNRQRLAFVRPRATTATIEDACTLVSYGVVQDSTLDLDTLAGYRGGDHVRATAAHGDGDGEFEIPSGMCTSHNGAYLFIADYGNHRVQVRPGVVCRTRRSTIDA